MDLSGVNYELAVDSGVAGIRHRKERQGLFSGLLFCPDCGNKLHFAACKNFDGKRRQKVEIFFNFVGRSPCWQNPCSQNLPLDAEKRRDLYIIDIIHIATGRLGPADGSAPLTARLTMMQVLILPSLQPPPMPQMN